MTKATDLMTQAKALLAEVARTRFTAADDESLCELMATAEQAGRLVDAVRVATAGEVAERSRHELGSDGLSFRLGHRRPVHLIEQVTRVSQAEAARRIRLGTATRPRSTLSGLPLPAEYPRVAAALLEGTMGVDAATAIIRCLGQAAPTAPPADLDAAEQALVDTAATQSADLVLQHARIWREALDPDGAEPRDAELRAKRRFSLGREVNGMTPFSGACEPTFAALLRSAFGEASAPKAVPRFLSEEDAARADSENISTPDGDIVVRLKDPRTPEQRQYDVLVGLVTAGIRASENAPVGQRSTATVMAVVQLTDLHNNTGVGWLDDIGEPVAISTLQQLICDSGYRKIILGPDGEVLHMGLKERFFTKAQRLALAVRDGGCIAPGCTAPPGWCEAHHVIEHENGGPTDISNAVLLCQAHHNWLHTSHYTMKMIRGKPYLLAPPWLDLEQAWKPLGVNRVTMTSSVAA